MKTSYSSADGRATAGQRALVGSVFVMRSAILDQNICLRYNYVPGGGGCKLPKADNPLLTSRRRVASPFGHPQHRTIEVQHFLSQDEAPQLRCRRHSALPVRLRPLTGAAPSSSGCWMMHAPESVW